LPTITGATALCEGTTTTLTGSGTASATAPWVSSDPSIASVDATGLVTGIAAGGPVTITYTNADGCTITSTITVNPLPTIGGTFTLCEGDTSILTGSGTPAATGAWVSDAPAVATVNATGTVAGIAGGTANITYTDANGCTSTQTVTIIALPTITGDTALCLGATTTLTGSGTASTTTPWTSSNPSIASIDATGLVTGNAAGGPVTITYMNSNGCTTTSTITVDPLPTIGGTFTLCEAATSTLTGSGTPAATGAWVSDDTSVATVDATGTVTGIAGGTANITYTDANGCTATQAITVIAAPTIGGTFNVCVGLTTALTASAAPSTGTPWASSNTTVATVSSTGVVAGVSAGTTVITFTDANGCQAQETVTVIALPTVTGATALPDVCIGTAMTSAVYTFGGSATGMTIDPAFTLPAGISLAPGAPNTYVLSGTPTMDGLYTFDIITTGGCTPADRITVTMTVKPDATLSAAPAGADDQTVCINVVINPIVFTVGNGATGAVVSAGLLPAGVTLTNSGGGTFTLSGSPTQAGIFNYTVTTTTVNGCTEASIPGRIEVLSPGTLVLTSAAGTTNQPACQDVNILPITYMPGNGATTVSVSGLPAGITGVMNTSTGAFEISGASNVIGAHPYTVSNTDGCLPFATLSGVITITPKASIVLTSAAWTDDQTLCMVQETLTDIVFTVADGATGASIVDGTVPVGISGSYDPLNHTFTIGGTPTESGTFSFKVRTTGGCGFSELEATITVDPLPTIVLPTDGFVCIDRNGNPVPGSTTTLTTGLPQANHTFEWSDANGIIAGATANSYEATAPGVYAVKVTNTVTGCSNSETTTVNSSLPPMSVTATASEYFTQDQMVTVVALPAGNYEYQMDNGAWQDTGNFYNLPSGEHHFKVRDKVGCGELETSIIIIDYPRFFTPNNDGYNDTWNIEDLNLLGNQETSKIEIYDRYGKLIKQISPLGIGWDGTFNGKMLPATDYWFRVYYTDEVGIRKEFKAHFSLKR
ncbi:Ig-like domain-containing protein, partial [Flavobacterium caeni]